MTIVELREIVGELEAKLAELVRMREWFQSDEMEKRATSEEELVNNSSGAEEEELVGLGERFMEAWAELEGYLGPEDGVGVDESDDESDG
jgi:hypothetical protein